MTLGEIDTLVYDIVKRSRATSAGERYAAINHGYRRLARAIRSVKADFFHQLTHGFILRANQVRFALVKPEFPRPVARITDIIALGATTQTLGGLGDTASSTSALVFEYGNRASTTFTEAKLRTPGSSSRILYDVVRYGGTSYLVIAPALSTDETPIIESVYSIPRLIDPEEDSVEAYIADHIEGVVAFALEWLLRAVNDVDADRWGADALQLRAEIIQDLAVKSEQNTVSVQSPFLSVEDF